MRKPPPGTHWRFTQEKIDHLEAEGGIYYSDTGMPYVKSYLDERKGRAVQSLWTDIPMPKSGNERLGYPTQKPIALLERIVRASSDEGDIVFDPFCGCGTAIYASHLTKRQWIGCDIAILSVRIVRDILKKRYGLREDVDYQVAGVPKSVDGAHYLFNQDKKQFQHWAVELAGGFCSTRTTGDRGIDGRIYFEVDQGLQSMVISVKGGGHITPSNIRELRGVLEREDAQLGGFICMEKPTKGMMDEAAAAGMYTYLGKSYPRLQLRTIEDLLEKRTFQTPSLVQTLDWERQGVIPGVVTARTDRARKSRRSSLGDRPQPAATG